MPVRGKNGGNAGQGSKWITRKRRHAIYARDKWRCVWCARLVDAPGRHASGIALDLVLPATLDHVVPREHGGDNTTPNLVTACMQCNRLRGTRTVLEFAFELMYTHRLVGSTASPIARVLRAVLTPLVGKEPSPPLDSLPHVRELEQALGKTQSRRNQ